MKEALAGMKKAKFSFKASPESEVYVTGTFNGWNPAKNKLANRDGSCSATILLPKGRHEYKFVVDGVWFIDPECLEWTPNGMGSLNSVIVVA